MNFKLLEFALSFKDELKGDLYILLFVDFSGRGACYVDDCDFKSWRRKSRVNRPRILPRCCKRQRFGAGIYLKKPSKMGSYQGATFVKQHILFTRVGQTRHLFLKVGWREFITLFQLFGY